MTDYFTKEEAALKVGKKVRTTLEWKYIPVGRRGTVVEIERTHKASPVFRGAVEWDLPLAIPPPPGSRDISTGRPISFRFTNSPRVWVTKAEYEAYLEEV
jgi:hypothetical protein